MDRIELIETFALVAKNESFSKAAAVLGQPPTTVSRKVSVLEEQLRTQLLARTTRSVKLTLEGKTYLQEVLPLVRSLQEADLSLRQRNRSASGELVITSPLRFGRHYLLPVVARFLNEYPKISIKHILSEQRLDYTEAGIDVGLRIGQLRDSSFKWIPLGKVRVLKCASPEYLDANGAPTKPAELNRHRTIAFSSFGERARWGFADANGHEFLIDVDPVYNADSVDAMVDFAVRGGGIGNFYSYQVAEHVAAGQLVPILDDNELEPRTVFFLYQDIGHLLQRSRLFLDFATPLLRSSLKASLDSFGR